MKKFTAVLSVLLCIVLLTSCQLVISFVTPTPAPTSAPTSVPTAMPTDAPSISLDDIPAYAGEPYVVINNNIPDFSESDMRLPAFESYAPLDSLGRCGVAFACISKELMPVEPRESISSVKPTGWHSTTYDCVDGRYLYNRCHLIGFQLTGENANEFNLITGTRYLNVTGMLPFEDRVAAYIRETDHKVLYRVTPCFTDNNLVCDGLLLEAASVEDDKIRICVYLYNVQPLVVIDYATGDSHAEEINDPSEIVEYVLNTGSKKFHLPTCSSCDKISESNRDVYRGTRSALIQQGYKPCGICNP